MACSNRLSILLSKANAFNEKCFLDEFNIIQIEHGDQRDQTQYGNRSVTVSSHNPAPVDYTRAPAVDNSADKL